MSEEALGRRRRARRRALAAQMVDAVAIRLDHETIRVPRWVMLAALHLGWRP